jgi:PAS domain S-box-containing protein
VSMPESVPSTLDAPEAGGLAVAVAAVSAQLAAEPDDAQVGSLVAAQVAYLLHADGAHLALLESDPAWLVVRHAAGPAAPALGTRQLSNTGVLGHVVQHGEAQLVADAAAEGLVEAGAPPAGSVVAVPLRFKGELLGGLQATRARGAPPFTPADQVALQLLADLAAARVGAATQSAALRERARELAVLAPAWRPAPDEAGDAVLVYDGAGRIVDVDEACCRLLDYPREEVLRLALWELSPFPPGIDAADVVHTQVEQARAAPITFETTARRRDGSLVPLRVRVQTFDSPHGPVIRGVAYDVSAEKRTQLRTLEAEKMRLLAEISSGIAHEINSPLAVVLGNTEMLLDESADPEQRSLLAPTRDAALRIAAAVQSIQQFARPKLPSGWAPVDVSTLAWETVELTRPVWQAEPQARGRPIRVRLETSSVPALHADPLELQTALRELISNAVQALPEGGTIVVRTEEVPGAILLSVADDGVGMPDEVLQRCMDPFFTTRRPRGTGLGLTRVYHAALRHHGQVTIDTHPGQGTRVTIQLPISPQE